MSAHSVVTLVALVDAVAVAVLTLHARSPGARRLMWISVAALAVAVVVLRPQ